MRERGPKPDGRPWAIAREKPSIGTREIDGILEIHDGAAATSGNYRHVTAIGERTMSDAMDPRTGAPLANDLSAVTVLTESCMLADSWATALMVSGTLGGLELARRYGLAAWFAQGDGGVLSTFA